MAVSADKKTRQSLFQLFSEKKRPLQKDEIASFLASFSESSGGGRKRKIVEGRGLDVGEELGLLCESGDLVMKEVKCEGGKKIFYFPSSPNSLAPLDEEEIERRELEKKLEKYKTEEFKDKKQKYINQLHRYNETKDTAQAVIGQIALAEKKTIKEVHTDFGVHGDL